MRGLNIHPWDTISIPLLQDTGATSLRYALSWQAQTNYPLLRDAGFSIMGLLCQFIVGIPPGDTFTIDQWRSAVAQYVNAYDCESYQIWNEVDQAYEQYAPADNPAGYVDVLSNAYDVIKSIRPNRRVVFSSLSNLDNVAPSGYKSAAEQWLDDCLALGADQYCDAYSISFYDVGLVSPVMEAMVAKTAKPWYITEIGASSIGNTEDSQVQNFVFLNDWYDDNASALRIAEAYYYQYMDQAEYGGSTDPATYTGLVRPDLSPKPIYNYFQGITPGPTPNWVIVGAVAAGVLGISLLAFSGGLK